MRHANDRLLALFFGALVAAAILSFAVVFLMQLVRV